jgi:aspartate aminotransferase-like enzyme
MKKEYLYTPGPVSIPPEVLLKLAEPIYHHRTKKFQAIFSAVNAKLHDVFKTANDIVTFTSSGTGAMEAALVNFLSAGDKIISVNGGKFGERWGKIAKAYGVVCNELKIAWGTSPDPQQIAAQLAADPSIKAVYIQLVETSTGTLFDVKAISEVVARTPAILVVDAISGLGADELPVDAWGVDVCVAGSQKALMIPPGLSFLSVSPKAWKLAETLTLPKFYFNAAAARKSLEKNDTPFTPAHTLVGALNVALDLITEEGIDAVVARHARLARAVRAGAQALGLTLFSQRPANALTAIQVPDGVDAATIISALKDDGIYVAAGQDAAKGKIFRVAMMGYAVDADVVNALAGIERALQKNGVAFTPGAGVAAAQQALLA